MLFSTGKVMVIEFLDGKGSILLDFLPKKRTITNDKYVNLLDQVRIVVR